MKTCLLALLCLAFATPAAAQNRSSKLKPLYFQADKNGLQVLPQRFEYTLLDEDRIRIGDILIDTTQITFQLEPSENKGFYRVRFTWPAGLVREGEITVKNNSGKAILNTELTKETVKVSESTPNGENLRSPMGSYVSQDIPASLVDDMKYFPFMTFCIYRESDRTRIYMCSKELYLSAQKGKMEVKSRSTTKRPAQVEINGKIVGNQGFIYLNSRKETVSLKAQTQTGAFLEIETRKKDASFIDVVEADDGERIILTASGAEPVDEKKVKKISETDWQISLLKERPVLYLKGDGDIPMRQEFYVRGDLPKAKDRPYLSPKSESRSYSSNLAFIGIAPENVKVKVPENDKTSTIEQISKNQFQWSIREIPPGVETRRYLTIEADGKTFTAGYEVLRAQPFGLGLGAAYQTPSGTAFGLLEFQWWFENFLFINSGWTRFKWGLIVERSQHLTESEEYPKVDFTNLELLWKAQEGFNLIDASWGLTLPVQMIQGESASATTFGIGAFWLKKPGNWLESFMDWSEYKLQYFAGSSGSDFKISSAYKLKATAYWQLNPQWYVRYGLGLSDYKYDPAPEKEEMQIEINGGIFLKF